MNIDNITNINSIMINRKKTYTFPFNSAFFMLLTETFLEIFTKHNQYGFISEYFA